MLQFPGGNEQSGRSGDVLFQTPGGADEGVATVFPGAEDAPDADEDGAGQLYSGRGEVEVHTTGAEVHTTGVVASICSFGAIKNT